MIKTHCDYANDDGNGGDDDAGDDDDGDDDDGDDDDGDDDGDHMSSMSLTGCALRRRLFLIPMAENLLTPQAPNTKA